MVFVPTHLPNEFAERLPVIQLSKSRVRLCADCKSLNSNFFAAATFFFFFLEVPLTRISGAAKVRGRAIRAERFFYRINLFSSFQ